MNNRGFTIVELLIVVLILVIMSLSAIPIYKNYVKKSINSEGEALARSVQLAERIYWTEFGDFYEVSQPTSFDETLGVDANENKVFKSYKVIISTDSPKKSYEIFVYGQNGNKSLTLSLTGDESGSDGKVVEAPLNK
ncbi:MAG: prepilin-type N-terminal cleavage/methylation domain-containing protein [Elusimicrobiota bacterium]|jgi:prepilin-type N-terminal cleavage/methylation domain-containing protein|nr:prepilin-type N-terminal cleavage/methylation domain-containing protein [Elusimicrobiota bacterium]